MDDTSQTLNRDPQTYAIIGAAIEVHKVLGHGFLEAVYQEALAEEFRQQKLVFSEQVELPIRYKGKTLATFYRADFVVFEQIIVEIMALVFKPTSASSSSKL